MKKLLSFFLAVCTILALFPGISITASAAEPITDKIIQERIDELDRLLSGKYFTVNGQGCRQWASNHGCSNCNVNNIIKSQWFKNMFGSIQKSQLFLNGGQSCMGFVEFAGWYIFRANNSDTVLRDSNVKYTNGFNYETISNALEAISWRVFNETIQKPRIPNKKLHTSYNVFALDPKIRIVLISVILNI